MRIYYKGVLAQIALAVEDANELLGSEPFYRLIAQSTPFKCTNLTPEAISNIIKESFLEVEVLLYKPQWHFSSVLGYFSSDYPNNIFLNARKIYRETNSITNTIIHEYVHAVDNIYDRKIINFGHDCAHQSGTAPYVIGQLAEKMVNKGLVEIKESFYPEEKIKILTNRII